MGQKDSRPAKTEHGDLVLLLQGSKRMIAPDVESSKYTILKDSSLVQSHDWTEEGPLDYSDGVPRMIACYPHRKAMSFLIE